MNGKQSVIAVAKALLGKYSAYRILTLRAEDEPAGPSATASKFVLREIDRHAVASSADQVMRDQAWYCGEGCEAFGCFSAEHLVGVCFYWHGARYNLHDFWPLAAREAKLVQIVTSPDMRGRGVATALIEYSAPIVIERGFDRLYARIWHSNLASLRAFERTGWYRIGTVVEVNPLRCSKPWRFVMRRHHRPVR